MAPFDTLYGQRCRTPLCWSDMEEKKNLGPELVREVEDKNSYVDLRRRDIEYQVGDTVFLKVSPWKKVLRSARIGKLSLRFIDPYEVAERIGLIEVQFDLSYEEESVVILVRELKVLHNKTVPLVKALWRNHKTEEDTWESKHAMKHQNKYLFDSGKFRG
ncbi:uncharacterized protein [Gossypium hirsutum]|uniref:Tf2-1-like SH3-like domain-containing protein n=1 Tax=Gossypium hirsutum TaxID=3635 RepID=A0A1U8KPB8_GOSHI|nr:uncharacterized protein LOC107919358 [Gossypium hirsutum]